MNNLGTIYILEAVDHSVIKIGFTTRLALRFEQLRAISLPWMDTDLVLIGYFPGTREVETQLHRRFAEFRIHGDWYRHKPIIEAFASVLLPVQPFCEPKVLTQKIDLNPHAVALGQRGGHARNDALSPDQRSTIARNAINARWEKVRRGRKAAA